MKNFLDLAKKKELLCFLNLIKNLTIQKQSNTFCRENKKFIPDKPKTLQQTSNRQLKKNIQSF